MSTHVRLEKPIENTGVVGEGGPDSKQRGQLCWQEPGECVTERSFTVANSMWECADGRVWDGSAISMCVSAGSRMFWSVLINNSLGRLEAGAGTESKH